MVALHQYLQSTLSCGGRGGDGWMLHIGERLFRTYLTHCLDNFEDLRKVIEGRAVSLVWML